MAGGDVARYSQIATGAPTRVGVFCLIAWACRLSVLVKLISDSVLTGFKAGAGLTIAMTQLPAFLGAPGAAIVLRSGSLFLPGNLVRRT